MMDESFIDQVVSDGKDWMIAFLLTKIPGEEVFIPFDMWEAFPLRGFTPKTKVAVYNSGILVSLSDE